MDKTAEINEAREIIRRATRELGRLSSGQKRDLLADNTDWDTSLIAQIVGLLERESV